MKRIKALTAVVLITLYQSGCKEPEYPIENEESYSKVFMQLASNGTFSQSLAIQDTWIKIPFGAGYGGAQAQTEEIKIEFEVSPELLETYNQQNNTNYQLPPAGSYRINELSVNIPVGKNGSNSIDIEVNPIKLNGTKAYMLPISIKNVSPNIAIAEGLKTTYFILNGFYETNPYTPISREGWEVIEVSSEQSDRIGGLGMHALDGDLYTCWLSRYSKTSDGFRPVHPHHLVFDMKSTQTLHGLQLFGRRPTGSQTQTSQDYLFPRNIHVETSDDGVTWQSAGVFTLLAVPAGATEATVYFEEAANCRYLKLNILSSGTGSGDTSGIAELVPF